MIDDEMNRFEPIQAEGIGAERFDEPALFYLTNQVIIDEWHALRKTVTSALNDWLETTAREAVAEIAQRHQLVVGSAAGPRRYSHIVAFPETMPIINGKPAVAVGLGWSKEGVNPISNPPFACVRRIGRTQGKVGAAALLDHGGRDLRSRESCRGRDDEVWPLYSNVLGGARWWTDLDSYLAAIAGTVETYIDGLDGALIAAAAAAASALPGPGEDAEEAEDDLL